MSHTVQRLSDLDICLAEQARSFCLRMIEHYYGIRHRPDWHADLDSMIGPAEYNWFSPSAGGGFWVSMSGDSIAATIGIYDLARKPATRSRLSARYRDDARVCQLVRAYTCPEYQGKGLGTALLQQAEAGASDTGYGTIYLHADAAADATLEFWTRRGYAAFGSDDTGTYIDFDKILNQQRPLTAR